ncbi:hypothetical protein C7999DRAFT_31901 [Corynascus novoguineensis]|uniref:Uncharacterized protein n=1 Tax=Corynascus novoguineensis TaxID=1126955 RepID=A0AAN7CSS5_9PEZI|nr:hypothetical protein C7999DRAFT_31901 [Corynascus novoguineensis]
MKISTTTLAAAAGLVSLSEGYRLSFYLGQGCRGSPLGTQFPVVDPPNYVCRGIPVNAQSVVVTAQDPQDSQSKIVFRQPEGCGGAIALTATGGCVNINNARSYQVHYR